MKKQANKVDWSGLIKNHRDSDQSMSTCCQANSLNVHQLTYKLQKEKRNKTLESSTENCVFRWKRTLIPLISEQRFRS